jgi:hypothetical protein
MLVNTHLFSETAAHKKKHGFYCAAPMGSKEYDDFWKIQDNRCINGYTVGNTRITGHHYFFLNFKQLEVVINPNNPASQKERTFPRFWEQHYEFFHALEQAEIAGKHFCILKPRGTGFSEIMSCVAVRDYTLHKGSKNFFFVSNEGFLNKDGVLTKCWDNLEFLNQDTENAYKHLRQKKDQDLHKRASEVDRKGNEYGYKSEIIGRVIDHPRKVRGARTGSRGKVYFEEGGSFPNLKSAVIATRPLVEQGGVTTGQIVVWGTGGEQGPGIEGLEHIFYHPDAYNMHSFANTWDDDRLGTRCAYFFPVYTAMDKFMDKDGNALTTTAKTHHDTERAKIRAEDPDAEDKYVAEYPYTPAEALLRLNENLFPVAQLQRQLARVQSDRGIQGFLKQGNVLQKEDGKFKFTLDNSARAVTEFPHEPSKDNKGCTTMVESPYKDQLGHTPAGIYTIVVDPYYKDDAESSVSLGSFYVYKGMNDFSESEDDILVAWFTGRPRTLDQFYRILFNTAQFYNASIQSEIAGGGKGILDYARNHKLLQFCEKEPDILSNKEINTKDINKPYFMKMDKDRVKLATIYLADWLMKERRTKTIDGEEISVMNLHKIYDEGLLKELIKYNDDANFDRVSALRILPFMIKERIEKQVMRARKRSTFWSRQFHSDEVTHDNTGLLNPSELTMQDDAYEEVIDYVIDEEAY